MPLARRSASRISTRPPAHQLAASAIAAALATGAVAHGVPLGGAAAGSGSASGTLSQPVAGLSVALKLTSTVGGTALPFAVAHGFKQGEVPAGSSIVASNTTAFQATIRNTWPDGSAKLAILCGRADFTANVQKTLTLTAGSAAGGTALTTTDLQATGITASIAFGAVGTPSWSGADWASPFQTIASGPTMSSWTYRKAIGSDAHLVAWLEVRLYAGGAVEVLSWIENGYLNVASPTSKTGTATFTLGGTSRYTGSLTILHHQRAVLASGTTLTHWLGTDPAITPQHDHAYLMGTKLVPTYGVVSVGAGSAVYGRIPTSYTPLAQGSYPTDMGSTGYDLTIGMLPEWEAAYFAGGADARAYRGTVINGYLAGRYGIHYRDETTNRPPLHASYPTLAISLSNSGIKDVGGSTVSNYTPDPTGTAPPLFASSHHPMLCYAAYLLTGWNWFMEEMQFLASTLWLKQTNNGRGGASCFIESSSGANQTRGAAWAIRSIACAASMTPDADSLRAQYTAAVADNIDYYHAKYIAQANNPLGVVQPYDIIDNGAGALNQAVWQDDFMTATFGWLKDLNSHSSTVQAKLDAFLSWKYTSIVGRLGPGTAGTYNYRYGGQFLHTVAPSTASNYGTGAGPWYADWGAAATAMGTPAADGGTSLQGTSGSDPAIMSTGYWGNLHPALAYAVDHGAAGAAAAYARLTSASNYASGAASFAAEPVWSVRPRASVAAVASLAGGAVGSGSAAAAASVAKLLAAAAAGAGAATGALGVTGAGASALATAAAGMTSGQWLNFSAASGTTGLGNFNSAPGQGASGIRTPYMSEFCYDATNKRFLAHTSDHAENAYFFVYEESTNAWRNDHMPPWGDIGGAATARHGYDHNTFAGGKFYTRTIQTTVLRRWNGGTSWTDVAIPLSYNTSAAGHCYHEALNRVLVFQNESGTNGALVGMNPDTEAWTTYVTAASGTLAGSGDYHNFNTYNRNSGVAWFGGGNGVTTNWTINSSGTVQAAAAIPGALNMIGPSGGGSLAMPNPSNGNFIVWWDASTWYDFNATTRTYSVRSGTATAFSTNMLSMNDGSAFGMAGVMGCTVWEYGVIVFVKTWSRGSPAEMWLFKP